MSDPLGYAVNCSILFTDLPLRRRPAAAKQASFDAVEFWWPFTVPEIRRLLTDAHSPPRPNGHQQRWQGWRRTHQARSRWFHKRARLARDTEITQVI